MGVLDCTRRSSLPSDWGKLFLRRGGRPIGSCAAVRGCRWRGRAAPAVRALAEGPLGGAPAGGLAAPVVLPAAVLRLQGRPAPGLAAGAGRGAAGGPRLPVAGGVQVHGGRAGSRQEAKLDQAQEPSTVSSKSSQIACSPRACAPPGAEASVSTALAACHCYLTK